MARGTMRMAAIAAISVVAGATHAQTVDELYVRAKSAGETSLVLYSGGPVAPYETFVKDFEKQFPTIKVSITGGFSNVLNAKIHEQMKAGKLETDMAFFQTAQDFVVWKKQGVLLDFKPEGYDHILPAFRDSDGAYTTTKVNAIAYGVNTSLVAPQDIPRSALDLLKPQFAGRIITCYPADDDATLYLFYTIVQKYGWSYMDRYMANKPNFVQGHLGVSRSVAAGDNFVTPDATSTLNELKAAGAPVEMVFSQDDPTPFFTLTSGVFKSAPHPEAAKLFLTWYMNPAQQKRTGVFSARDDVPPPSGFKPLPSYNAANGYVEFVSNETVLKDLRNRMEKYTGPVVNTGGVR